MINVSLYLDTRAVHNDEPAPLKVSINKRRQTSYISLGIKLRRSQWDSKTQSVLDAPNKTRLNIFIKQKLLEIENIILDLQLKGELSRKSSTQIKDIIVGHIDPEFSKETLFLYRYELYMDSRQAKRTREIYATTYKKIIAFDKKVASYSFEDITKDWLLRFDMELRGQGLKKNSRNIHFRNIRSVFNDAIDNEVTSHYPFRNIDIKPEETMKRSLSISEIRLLFNHNVESWQKKYIDYFKLSFMLIGINPADLLNCKHEDFSDGRLNYRRKKTLRLYSVKIEPEAIEIMKRYSGTKNLLNFSEKMKDYKFFVCKANKALKKICGMINRDNDSSDGKNKCIFPDISLYWARHTWATIAFSIGIHEEIIAEALGHSHGNRTTAIYIDKSVANIDAANRKVLDYVLYKEQPKD